MLSFFRGDLGLFGMVNVIIALAVIILAVKIAIELYIRKRNERLLALENSINAILFWSGLIVVLGFLQSFWGAITVISSVVAANVSDPLVILGGVADLLKNIILSLSFFSIFSIVWFVFRNRYIRLLDKSM